MPTPTNRVSITPQAAEVLQHLIDIHGPVMFHQSGGCCDGSAPMCYPNGEFRVGAADVLLGHIHHETPFWISADQYKLWQHTQLTVDVTDGRGSGFSLEAPEGVRFLIRSEVMSSEQLQSLSTCEALQTGDSVRQVG
ncbi:hypothetical protein Mycch_5924 (plasmid) [Mycolicibacterium chubuense NBB4]|uniref:DUF779 domain-containing protein n=2 Tax=Mycolicibacterium TaxID=1866885 RepID=I4BTC5_MYCCN|nr:MULTISPECIES: DUF779 domain-containing protein [Mycolicibacterium]AFM20532.1 hypothetical protein Mycch_5924 [Mycolicibacterium chubuense NBB4]NTY64000.1 DUF779 domain-containing protein [Mycolicibacterium sphagni]